MKKLLILMLVLGLVSAANAVLSLSVDGVSAPPEITLNPSDTIVIDIQSDNNVGYNTYLYIWRDGPRTISNPRVTQGNNSSYYGPYFPGYYGGNYDYYAVSISDTGGNLVPGTGFEIDFHCDGPGDVLLQLIDFNTFAVLDSLVIHQPEPMTIALLGLGGLFLRRRKK